MKIVNKILSKIGKVNINLLTTRRNDLTAREKYFSTVHFGRPDTDDDYLSYVDLHKLYQLIIKNVKTDGSSVVPGRQGLAGLHNSIRNAIIVHNPNMLEAVATSQSNNNITNSFLNNPSVALFDSNVPEGIAHVVKFNQPVEIKDSIFGALFDLKNSVTVEKMAIHDDTLEYKASQPHPPTLAEDPLPRYLRDRESQRNKTLNKRKNKEESTMELASSLSSSSEFEGVDYSGQKHTLYVDAGGSCSYTEFSEILERAIEEKVEPLVAEGDIIEADLYVNSARWTTNSGTTDVENVKKDFVEMLPTLDSYKRARFVLHIKKEPLLVEDD